MSRWLSSVNSLLEKLDGQAEQIVEEHAIRRQEQAEDGNVDGGGTHGGAGVLEDILMKRGLSSASGDEEGNKGLKEDARSENDGNGQPDVAVVAPQPGSEAITPVDQRGGEGEDIVYGWDETQAEEEDVVAPLQVVNDRKSQDEEFDVGTTGATNPGPPTEAMRDSPTGVEHGKEHVIEKRDKNEEDQESGSGQVNNNETTAVPPNVQTQMESSVTSSGGVLAAPFASKVASMITNAKPTRQGASITSRTNSGGISKKEFAEAQKEARTLRRHVVSLNAQLEAAESEMKAQRMELEQVGERMEKDRQRSKQQLEQLKTKQAQELTTMKQQHDHLLHEAQQKFQEQMKEYQGQLQEMEHRRKQEGGDLNKELSDALDREHEMIQSLAGLKEEKSVLESQIATLQNQQEALGSRLESLTQTADNAMEREREAENRLDDTLSQHARQISQRQAREAELERTVQQLGAALVAAKNQASTSSWSSPPTEGEDAGDNAATTNDMTTLRARIGVLESDLGTAYAHLSLEKERTEAMHEQLRAMSKENSKEASTLHAQQVQHERQIADLSLTISKLEASLREARRGKTDSLSEDGQNIGHANDERASSTDKESDRQVKMLSDELFRLRDKVANHASESLALRNRLKEATDRASKAEEKLSTALAGNGTSDSMYESMERAGSLLGNGAGRRRKAVAGSNSGSIRAVMRLNPGQGERQEQLGKAIDAVDSFTKSTAKYIRQNPLARAGFVVYFLLIHFWTFVVFFLHAHSFDPSGGESGGPLPHGIHSMMQQQQQQVSDVAAGSKP